MRYRIIAILCLILTSPFCNAQKHSELGITGGGFYYVGELNPDKHFLNGVKFGGGLVYRRVLNKRYALKFNALYGKLEASDQQDKPKFQNFRSYAFNSTVIEGAGHIEFNFLPYVIGRDEYPFTPYVFCGLNIFYANPESFYIGGNDLNLNEAGSSNSIIAPAFPFGAGLKYTLLSHLGLSLEWGLRKTFTDQLDALNNRYTGNSLIPGFQKGKVEDNDWYSYIGIMLTYRFNAKVDKCPAYNF